MTSLDEDFTDFEDAADNPALLAAAQAVVAEDRAPALEEPLDGPVILPAGFRRVKVGSEGSSMEEVRTAWVRELNGVDEERISRAKMKNDVNAFLRAILESGVERLGDVTPTRADFDLMVVGDHQYLLTEIARATYGDELEYKEFVCPHCQQEFDVTLSIKDDIPVKRLEKVEDGSFDVRLHGDRVARVVLPTGEVSDLMAKADTPAETNTIIVAHCVEEIRGPKGSIRVSGDVEAARRLGVRDRQAIVNALGDRMPGPQYNEVKFNHEPGCGEEIRLSVTLADLFRGL